MKPSDKQVQEWRMEYMAMETDGNSSRLIELSKYIAHKACEFGRETMTKPIVLTEEEREALDTLAYELGILLDGISPITSPVQHQRYSRGKNTLKNLLARSVKGEGK